MRRRLLTVTLAAALAAPAGWPGAAGAAETLTFGIVSANPNY